DRAYAGVAAQIDVKKVADETGVDAQTIEGIADAFGRGKPALAIAGGAAASGSNATQVQTAVALLNAATGNVGKTMRFGPDWAYGKATPYAEVAKLVQAMAAGEIEVLLLGPGVNPAFTLPGGLKAADAIKKVPFVVSFGNLPDETTTLAHLILPDTHWLESWGDYAPRAFPSLRMYDGRGASRAWLQEAPDPITSVAWDAWVEIAAETATALGITRGDVVRVTSPHGAIELPAYPTPTLHPKAVAIPIGHRYARYHVPRYVGMPPTSQNPVALLSGAPEALGGGVQYLGVRVTLAKTGARRP